jgi:sialidase-1
MMNIRNQRGDIRQRIIGLSDDGGATWKETYFDAQLPDPICEGSILTIAQAKGKNILAFSNSADVKRRDQLTLRISYDDGKTWPNAKLIAQSSTEEEAKHDFAAYSDLVLVNKKTVGILYERKDYSQIVFTAIRWDE